MKENTVHHGKNKTRKENHTAADNGTGGDDGYLWFRPLIFKWFAGVAVFVGFGMGVYGIFLKGSYVPFALTVGTVSLVFLLLQKYIPYQVSSFALLSLLTVLIALRSASIHSAINASFLSIILIVASIITSPVYTTILFVIHMGYVLLAASFGILSFTQRTDPQTGLTYANTVTVLIPLMIISYVVSMVVSRVLIGTIEKQIEQYRLLQKAQEKFLMQEKLESLRILTGGIAHDFNNILTSILGNINLIRLDPEDRETLTAGLADAENAAIRAKNLTGQLLMVTKGDSPFKSISSLKETIVDTVKFSLHGSRARPMFDIEKELWPVDADIMQISQVLQNLVINADQAMPEGGTIIIRAGNIVIDEYSNVSLPGGEYVRICVEDQGVGIATEHLDKIYDPFFTTKDDGTGLGLTICYSIINNHNGIVNVESRPGEGTEFCFYLPACSDAVPEDRTAAVEKKPVTGRVLIMDDDEGVIRILGRMLRVIGYDVENAFSGEEAVDVFKKARNEGKEFLFVIMDLTVPGGMDGIETMRIIKDIDPNIKAVISSGYSDDRLGTITDREGIDAILPKPYTIEDLIAVLNNLLEKK